MHMPGHEPLTGQGSYSCDNLLPSHEYSRRPLSASCPSHDRLLCGALSCLADSESWCSLDKLLACSRGPLPVIGYRCPLVKAEPKQAKLRSDEAKDRVTAVRVGSLRTSLGL